MHIAKEQAKKISNADSCTVWEYSYPSELSSLATAHIDGRYPESGTVANTECEEVYYVIAGDITIHSTKGTFECTEGDVYFFEKGEEFWVDGHECQLVLMNAPKWNSEQHKESPIGAS
jgi:mannose-6-phosphate isomerase-like protein (cupin superfamily)